MGTCVDRAVDKYFCPIKMDLPFASCFVSYCCLDAIARVVSLNLGIWHDSTCACLRI